MERNLALELVRVTEAAALASARWMGKGDGLAADRAACEAMSLALDSLKIDGTIALGERHPDARLARGSRVGREETSRPTWRSIPSSPSTRWPWGGRTGCPLPR